MYQTMKLNEFGDQRKIRIVKLRSWSRSGEGQEGQSQAKSSSENSKLKDLDLSHTINLVFTTHPPPVTFFLAFKGSRHVRWT